MILRSSLILTLNIMEEGDLNGGDISDSPTISDERTLSDSEADPGRASDFFDYTPSQSFNAPVSYLEVLLYILPDFLLRSGPVRSGGKKAVPVGS